MQENYKAALFGGSPRIPATLEIQTHLVERAVYLQHMPNLAAEGAVAEVLQLFEKYGVSIDDGYSLCTARKLLLESLLAATGTGGPETHGTDVGRCDVVLEVVDDDSGEFMAALVGYAVDMRERYSFTDPDWRKFQDAVETVFVWTLQVSGALPTVSNFD